MNPQREINIDHVKEFVLEAVYSDHIVKKARELDIEKNVFNPYRDNLILKHRIAILYNKTMIDDQIPEITTDALRKFYEVHRETIFYQLKKVNISARIYSDSIKAIEEINRINAGAQFEEISNRWLTKSFVRERDGKFKSYMSTEPIFLAEASFKLGLNEVAGPIEYFDPEKGKQFAVIKCVAIRDEKQLTYDEAKNLIENEFIKYHKQKLTEEVERRLKSKYKIEIYDNYLSELINSVK